MERRNVLNSATYAAVAVGLLWCGAPARTMAQSVAAQTRRCVQTAQNDEQIVTCLKKDLAGEETKLRAVEQRLRAAMPDTAKGTFDVAARAWSAYRDAECQSVYSSYSGGTYNLMGLFSCRAALTLDRRKALEQIYRLGE